MREWVSRVRASPHHESVPPKHSIKYILVVHHFQYYNSKLYASNVKAQYSADPGARRYILYMWLLISGNDTRFFI
jgi:hypothetical protein